MKLIYGSSDILSFFVSQGLPYEQSRQYLDAAAWYSAKQWQPRPGEAYIHCYQNLFQLLEAMGASPVVFIYWATDHRSGGLAMLRCHGYLNSPDFTADFKEWWNTNSDEQVYYRIKDQLDKGIMMPTADPCFKMEKQLEGGVNPKKPLPALAANQLQAMPMTRKLCKKTVINLENEHGVIWIH